jgi:hypothetical protein
VAGIRTDAAGHTVIVVAEGVSGGSEPMQVLELAGQETKTRCVLNWPKAWLPAAVNVLSPLGDYVALDHIVITRVDAEPPIIYLAHHCAGARFLRWLADGPSAAYYLGSENAILIVNTEGSLLRQHRLNRKPELRTAIALSPKGDEFVYVARDQNTLIHEGPEDALTEIPLPPGGWPMSDLPLSWEDPDQVVFVWRAGNLLRVDLKTKKTTLLSPPLEWVDSFHVDPKGKRVYWTTIFGKDLMLCSTPL